MKIVPPEERCVYIRHNYLPHQAVIKENSSTTKLRVRSKFVEMVDIKNHNNTLLHNLHYHILLDLKYTNTTSIIHLLSFDTLVCPCAVSFYF